MSEGRKGGRAKDRDKGAIEANVIKSIRNLMSSLSFASEQAMESMVIPRSEY